ncbi:MAG: hypothetical protein WC080_04125 [Patescibacteria group bacterium]|jgi:hypothetical protein
MVYELLEQVMNMRKWMLLVGLVAMLVAILISTGCGGGGGGSVDPAFPTAGVKWATDGLGNIARLDSGDGITYLTMSRDGTGNGQIKVYNTADVEVGSVPIRPSQEILSLALRSLDLGQGTQPYLLMQYEEGSWWMEVVAMDGNHISVDGAAACLAANFAAEGDIVTTNNGTTIAGHLTPPSYAP